MNIETFLFGVGTTFIAYILALVTMHDRKRHERHLDDLYKRWGN